MSNLERPALFQRAAVAPPFPLGQVQVLLFMANGLPCNGWASGLSGGLNEAARFGAQGCEFSPARQEQSAGCPECVAPLPTIGRCLAEWKTGPVAAAVVSGMPQVNVPILAPIVMAPIDSDSSFIEPVHQGHCWRPLVNDSIAGYVSCL